MKNTENEILENEWSHLFKVEELQTGKPLVLEISPNEEESKRLCQRLDLLSIDKLTAKLKITQESGSMIVHIKGHIEADFQQSCVVTLEPVEAKISEEFEAWFADTAQAVPLAKARHEREQKSGQNELQIMSESEDPEPITNGYIDLGELVTQYLSLSINPYPHAKGVNFEVDTQSKKQNKGDDITNPFAALKDWKDRLTKGTQ